MIEFARTCQAIAATGSKITKVETLAAYFRNRNDADLEASARFFTGNPFAARDQRSLNLGGRGIIAVAARVWGITSSELSSGYRETGDLGSALGPLVRPSGELQLFEEDSLTPAVLKRRFDEISAASGKNAGKRRETILESILRSCTDPFEATYVIKIVTGDLRIGLREGLVHDAVAAAFETTYRDVHRAVMASGDIGEVAVAAKHRRLDRIHVAYGSPVGIMLASPVPYGDAYKDLAGYEWVVEDKYDGIRAQAHVHDGRVQLFTRALNDVTHSYPEIVRALETQSRRMILDGEIVASRDGKLLPFRILQARLQRKEIDPSLLEGVPLSYVIFDALAIDDEFLIDEPLLGRRERLAAALQPHENVILAPFEALEKTAPAEAVNERFEAARARGNEGLIFKRTDAPYVPGRRGKWWLKLKRELTTLDVVVVAVEWGHGRRAKVLSDYTFAVQDDEGNLLTIGKAYSGLTDVEIAEMTQWFLAHQRGKRGYAISVDPEVVLEVAFDIVQRSELHESGYALRFPRIVRIRDDKPVSQINTVADVDEIYREMLAREGIDDTSA